MIMGKLVTELPKEPQQPIVPKGVVVDKFMLIITRYPNGVSFPRIFHIGSEARQNTNKSKVKKTLKQVTIQEAEVY